MKRTEDRFRSELGAAQLVENIIVLPVVFAVILFIIYLGQMQYEKALISSVAERAIIWIEQASTDYQYKNLASLDLTNGASDIESPDISSLNIDVNRQPYRYVAGIFKSNDYSDAEAYIKSYIESKQIFPMGGISVEIKETGSLYKKVYITIEQDLTAPEIIPGLNLPTVYHYSYTAMGNIVQPSEMIRNTDFVYELVEPYISKAEQKLSEVAKKINTVMDKIKMLNSK